MWKKIKDYIWVNDAIPDVVFYSPVEVVHDTHASDIVNAALAHYCSLCKRGFKTRSGATNHKRLQHPG